MSISFFTFNTSLHTLWSFVIGHLFNMLADTDPSIGQSTEGGTDNTLFIALIVSILVILIIVTIVMAVFVHLYCRLRQTRSRVGSATSRALEAVAEANKTPSGDFCL